NEVHVVDFLPPPPTVRVELNGVNVVDFLPPPPTVALDEVYADDLRPLGDFPLSPTVGQQCVEPTISVLHTPPVAKDETAVAVLAPCKRNNRFRLRPVSEVDMNTFHVTHAP
ncbi:unnamed protein product, partial [Laminaria digitata]